MSTISHTAEPAVATVISAPRARSEAPLSKAVSLIGAPSDLGGNRRGAAMGPAALRAAGIAERFASHGLRVTDIGDATVPRAHNLQVRNPKKRYIEEIAVVAGELYRLTLTALDAGRLPVIMGGDHSVSAGSAAASATHVRERSGKSMGVIWIDAHGDMNTPATTLTGNVHGMPLAALIGDEPSELAAIGGWTRKIAPEHVVLLGVRSLDAAERRAIDEAGMHVFTAADIARRGVDAIMREAMALLSQTDGVHVSLDLDVCDPEDAPGVSTPVADGLSRASIHAIMRTIAAEAEMIALDIVEVNPACDVRNATAELGIEFALSAFGAGAAAR